MEHVFIACEGEKIDSRYITVGTVKALSVDRIVESTNPFTFQSIDQKQNHFSTSLLVDQFL